MKNTNVRLSVIYARYSSHKQNDESIEQQVEACQEYAKQNNLQVIDIYADRAVSGKSDQRIAFQKMLRDSAKGKFTVVIAYKSNRIGRNMLQALSNEDKLARNGVTVEYAKETFGNDAAGRFALRSMMNLNQFYSENLGEDVLRGMKATAREGKAVNKAPFGYSIVDGKFTVNSEQAKAVKEIYRLYIEGTPMARICSHLTSLGYRSANGTDFTIHVVRNVLTREIYTGKYQWNGIEYDNVPAIIDQETWDKARAQRSARSDHPQKYKARETYYLTGKLFCSDCGGRMSGTSAQFKGKTYRWYICKEDKRKVQKNLLEDTIVEKTQEVLAEGDMFDTIVAEIVAFNKQMDEKDHVIESLRKELNDVQKGLNNIVQAIEKGIVFDELTERYSGLASRKKELEHQIASRSRMKPKLSKADVEEILRAYTRPMIENNYEDAKKLILEEFVHHAVLYDDKVVVYYNFLNPDKEPINKSFKVDVSHNSTIASDGSPNSEIIELDRLLFICLPIRISQ